MSVLLLIVFVSLVLAGAVCASPPMQVCLALSHIAYPWTNTTIGLVCLRLYDHVPVLSAWLIVLVFFVGSCCSRARSGVAGQGHTCIEEGEVQGPHQQSNDDGPDQPDTQDQRNQQDKTRGSRSAGPPECVHARHVLNTHARARARLSACPSDTW